MNNLSAHRLLAEALGVLESEYEGTDCHQELIEKIKKELEEQKIAEEYFENIRERLK